MVVPVSRLWEEIFARSKRSYYILGLDLVSCDFRLNRISNSSLLRDRIYLPLHTKPTLLTLALGFKLLMQSALWCSLGLSDCACVLCWPLLFIPSCILPAPTFECCVRDCQTSLDTKTYTHLFFLHYLLFISFFSIIYFFLHTESTNSLWHSSRKEHSTFIHDPQRHHIIHFLQDHKHTTQKHSHFVLTAILTIHLFHS